MEKKSAAESAQSTVGPTGRLPANPQLSHVNITSPRASGHHSGTRAGSTTFGAEGQCPWLTHIGLLCPHPLPLPPSCSAGPSGMGCLGTWEGHSWGRHDTWGWMPRGGFKDCREPFVGVPLRLPLWINVEKLLHEFANQVRVIFLCSQNCLHPQLTIKYRYREAGRFIFVAISVSPCGNLINTVEGWQLD